MLLADPKVRVTLGEAVEAVAIVTAIGAGAGAAVRVAVQGAGMVAATVAEAVAGDGNRVASYPEQFVKDQGCRDAALFL